MHKLIVKPCPICKAKEIYTEMYLGIDDKEQWFCECPSFSCNVCTENYPSEEKAIEAWNHRKFQYCEAR